jgi:hypothetical protein
MEDDNDQTYVKLISADAQEFFIERRIALQVDTMKAMLEGNFKESEEGGKFCQSAVLQIRRDDSSSVFPHHIET